MAGQPALLVKGGAPGLFLVTYGQRSATEFIRTIQCRNGGVAYGTPTEKAGLGLIEAYRNAETTRLYRINDRNSTPEGSQIDGSFPGVGGSCGY